MDEESTRSTLIDLYSQKSTDHIGYLIASILAFLGFISLNLSNVPLLFSASIAGIFIGSVFYFFCRAYYWSLLIDQTMNVRIYTEEEMTDNLYHKENYENYLKLYNNSQLFCLHTTATQSLCRVGKYKNEIKHKKNKIAIIFNSDLRFISSGLITIICFILILLFNIFILKNSII
jgi:hypothetical protein